MSVQLRADGRKNNQLRAMAAEVGLLNRADGSARFSHNKTSVLAAVHGPMEVKRHKESFNKATLEVIFKPRSGIATPQEKEMELILRQTLETVVITNLHPQSCIQIVLQVLNDDGSLLSASINAAMLALMDAGVSVKSVLVSVTCAVTQDQNLIIDPLASEEKDCSSVCSFAFDTKQDGLVTSKVHGAIDESLLFKSMDAARLGTSKVAAFLRLSMERKSATILVRDQREAEEQAAVAAASAAASASKQKGKQRPKKEEEEEEAEEAASREQAKAKKGSKKGMAMLDEGEAMEE